MLTQEKATRGFELFDKIFIRRNGTLLEIHELRALLASATEAQRTWITQELDEEAQGIAVATAMRAIAALVEITDPLRELVIRRWRSWMVAGEFARGFELPAAARVSDTIPAPPMPAQSKLAKRREAQRHAAGRSVDGKRPWSRRLRPPSEEN